MRFLSYFTSIGISRGHSFYGSYDPVRILRAGKETSKAAHLAAAHLSRKCGSMRPSITDLEDGVHITDVVEVVG